MEVIVTPQKKRPTFVPDEQPPVGEDGKPIEPPAMTDAEIEAARQNALQVMGYIPPTEEFLKARAKARTQEEPPPEEPEPKVAPKEEPPPPAKPAKPAAAAPPQPLDAQAISDAVERGTTAALRAKARNQEDPPEEPPAKPEDQNLGLSEDDQEDLAVMRRIETADPKRKGLGDKYIAFTKELSKYRNDWQRENPNAEFNPNDAAHDEFYTKHPQPEITTKELDKERRKMIADDAARKAADEASAPLKKKLDEVERREAQRDMQARQQSLRGEVVTAVQSHLQALVKIVDPQAATLITGADGKPSFTPENLKKLEDYDPYFKEQLDHAAEVTGACVAEIRKWNDPEMRRLGFQLDPKTNKVHQHIAEVAVDAERTLMDGPEAARLKDGKQFVTSAKWSEMLGEAKGDRKRVEAIVKGFWTYTPTDLEQLVVGYQAGDIQRKIKQLETFASARAKRTAQPSTQQERPLAEDPPPTITRERRRFPNSSADTDVRPAGPGNTPAAKNFSEEAIAVAFRR